MTNFDREERFIIVDNQFDPLAQPFEAEFGLTISSVELEPDEELSNGVQVYCEIDGIAYLMATLVHGETHSQEVSGFSFAQGALIRFFLRGAGKVTIYGSVPAQQHGSMPAEHVVVMPPQQRKAAAMTELAGVLCGSIWCGVYCGNICAYLTTIVALVLIVLWLDEYGAAKVRMDIEKKLDELTHFSHDMIQNETESLDHPSFMLH